VFADAIASLKEKGLNLACAESLTGGMLSSAIVDTPGASQVFLGGVIAYDTTLKSELLFVSPELLTTNGTVDPQVAQQMALGVRQLMAKSKQVPIESIIGLATTGVAGPEVQGDKPVGLVYLSISGFGSDSAVELHLSGSRADIRLATVVAVAKELSRRLQTT